MDESRAMVGRWRIDSSQCAANVLVGGRQKVREATSVQEANRAVVETETVPHVLRQKEISSNSGYRCRSSFAEIPCREKKELWRSQYIRKWESGMRS